MAKKEKEDSPNVMFIGAKIDQSSKDVKAGEKGFVPAEPIKAFTDGMEHFKLPADQSKPFYFKEAARLTRLFPFLYKSYVEKGAK